MAVGASVKASVGADDGPQNPLWKVCGAVSVRPDDHKNGVASDSELDPTAGFVGSAVGAPEVGASVGTAAAQLAMRRLAAAQGLGGEVVAAPPHLNSQASGLSVQGLQRQEDPSSWTSASDTVSEAAFIGPGHRAPGDKALAQEYLRRRLTSGQKVPAWLQAVAEDVPAASRWWK